MTKSAYTPRIGSITFNTSVMKTDEVILFVKSAMESGVDIQTAYDDMKMIDDLLYLERLHIAVHGMVAKTKAGYYRKGTLLHDSMNRIIESRCINK